MIAVKDIAWLAGFLEGEGTFGRYRNCLVIRAASTDKDVVCKAAKLLNCPVHDSFHAHKKNPKHNLAWCFSIHGNRAAAWMMTLYPLMGKRRQASIREILDMWKTADVTRRRPRDSSYYQELAS